MRHPPSEYIQPPLLIVGPSDLALAVKRSLLTRTYFNTTEVLTRRHHDEVPALLRERHDVGVVLLLWQDPCFDNLLVTVQAILSVPGKPFKTVMIRSHFPLTENIGDALWQLGVADLAFEQTIPSAALLDALSVAMREYARNRSLAAVSTASGRFATAKTLRNLAAQSLQIIHEHGIGKRGGLFCFLGNAKTDRIMVIAGTGCYGRTEAVPLEKIDDLIAVETIRQAVRDGQSVFRNNAPVFYIKTPDGHLACVFLSLTTLLTSWQQGFVEVLARTIGLAIDQTQLAHRLLRTQHATITAMATLAEYRDVDTGEHVARVARAATEIAMALSDRGDIVGIDEAFIDQIGLASILHDIGKIAIPENILLKPGPLTLAERLAMQQHVTLGEDILLRAARRSDNGDLLREAAKIALCHHEKYDGTGYPTGLCGEEIPLAARIVALVDVFDALTSLRPYKQAWPIEEALAYISAEAGKHFDPIVVEEFKRLEERKKTTKFIVWNESMSVGHADLDFDHQRLISIINRLGLASIHGNRRVIEFILDDLVNYTEFHFKREEQLLESCAYEDYARHCAVHQSFCLRIEDLRWEYFQGIRDEPTDEILEYLTSWLNHHILEEDMAYRSALVTTTPARPTA